MKIFRYKIALFIFFAGIIFNFQAQNFVGKFNGTSSYVDLGYNVTNYGVRSITFNFIPAVNINGNGHDGYSFIARNDPSEWKEYGVYIRGTDWVSVGSLGRLCFWYRDNHILHEIMSDQNTWTAGTCYHVAGIIDPVQGMKLYINGVLQTQTDPSGFGPVLQDNAYRTTIGCWGDYYNRFFNGTINNMALWNTALTVPQIQNTISGIFIPADPKQVALYKFEEGSGPTLLDASVNLLNGTVYSMTWMTEKDCLIPQLVNSYSKNQELISLYPNPANGKIIVSGFSVSNHQYIEIFNALGDLVIKQEIKEEKTEVDLSGQARGIYIVRLGNSSRRIVKE